MDISKFIEGWTTKHNVTPENVNKGKCENFAQDLSKHLPDSRMQYIEEFFDWFSPEYPGAHIWVLHQGFLYDSETPTGVKHWSELPFYIRRKERQ